MLSILLPTDFSENSWNAIKYALEFFKYQKTEFYFMHAYQNEFYDHDDLTSRDEFDDVLNNVRIESQKNLSLLLKKVKRLAPHPRFTYHTVSSFNSLVEEASLIVDGKNIDVIVMGTKGKSDERHIVFGSQTFQVIKYVHCPVLAIPSDYSNTQPRNILFPTDYMIPYKRRELKLLSVLAKSYRSKVQMLYVSNSTKLSIRQEDNKAFLEGVLADIELIFIHKPENKIVDTIKAFINDNNIDMLTMLNTQHSFLEDMLFPSNLDKVSLGLKIPLLAMQNSTRF